MRTIHKATVGVADEGLENVKGQSAFDIHATHHVMKHPAGGQNRPTR
jgi:hypothetical protein